MKWFKWLLLAVGVIMLSGYLAGVFVYQNKQFWPAVHMAMSVISASLVAAAIFLIQQAYLNNGLREKIVQSLVVELDHTIDEFSKFGEVICIDGVLEINGVHQLTPAVFEQAISSTLFDSDLLKMFLIIYKTYTTYNLSLSFLLSNSSNIKIAPVAAEVITHSRESILANCKQLKETLESNFPKYCIV